MNNVRIAPFSTEDFSQGIALGRSHATACSDSEIISAALSLYFQWQEYSHAVIQIPSLDSGQPIEVAIAYDRDEANPTEFTIKAVNYPSIKTLVLESPVFVKFEVFNTAYIFSATVLAQLEDTFGFVISVPESISIEKLRKLPRIRVSSVDADRIGRVSWRSAAAPEESVQVVLTEIGLGSLRTSVRNSEDIEKIGVVDIAGNTFSAELVRRTSEDCIFQLSFSSSQEMGRFFDIYISIAYPNLRRRDQLPPKEVMNAYLESGYFSKFASSVSPEDFEKRISDTLDTWYGASKSFHETTADYVSVNSDNHPTGASSLFKAFLKKGRPVWVIQQLCSVARPEYIEQTIQLYMWRAEYLTALPGDLDVTCWFDGNSRWIERIWLKFAEYCGPSRVQIRPVLMKILEVSSSPSDSRVYKYNVGEVERTGIEVLDGLVAIDPPYINAAGALNIIALPEGEDTLEAVKEIGSALAHAAGHNSTVLRATFPPSLSHTEISSLETHGLNRHCLFSKEMVPYLYSSLSHSLAVMRRKLSDHG